VKHADAESRARRLNQELGLRDAQHGRRGGTYYAVREISPGVWEPVLDTTLPGPLKRLLPYRTTVGVVGLLAVVLGVVGWLVWSWSWPTPLLCIGGAFVVYWATPDIDWRGVHPRH